MKVVTKNGESFILYQSPTDRWFCPVCGQDTLLEPAYCENGSPSFQLCSCGFEFGYDDSCLASDSALKGIQNNWIRWRQELYKECKNNPQELEELKNSLQNIGINLSQ